MRHFVQCYKIAAKQQPLDPGLLNSRASALFTCTLTVVLGAGGSRKTLSARPDRPTWGRSTLYGIRGERLRPLSIKMGPYFNAVAIKEGSARNDNPETLNAGQGDDVAGQDAREENVFIERL